MSHHDLSHPPTTPSSTFYCYSPSSSSCAWHLREWHGSSFYNKRRLHSCRCYTIHGDNWWESIWLWGNRACFFLLGIFVFFWVVASTRRWLKVTHISHKGGTHSITCGGAHLNICRFDSSEVWRAPGRHLKLQSCWHGERLRAYSFLRNLGRLQWNRNRTVLETAELFWQTGHRSTWPGLCVLCSWNLITHREGGGGGPWLGGDVTTPIKQGPDVW